MNAIATRPSNIRALVAVMAAAALFTATAAHTAPITYVTAMSGANESPPNASPGTGTATLIVDTTSHQWTMHVDFTGLLGNTSAAHTHAPTTVAGTGTAGVATTTPYFAGFPIGVTSGTYDNTFDMTQASSFNASFITANGGTTASAEIALANAIAAGKAYLNIHSSVVPSGEIRGFWTAAVTVQDKSWGAIRNLYR
jgi:hypothetical protein